MTIFLASLCRRLLGIWYGMYHGNQSEPPPPSAEVNKDAAETGGGGGGGSAGEAGDTVCELLVTQSARSREEGGPDGIKDNGGGLQNDKTLNGFE